MPGIGTINLKVLLFDTDFYALQSVNSYLAWDRRTRVTHMAETLESMWEHIRAASHAELPDYVVIASDNIGEAGGLQYIITELRHYVPDVRILCLAQEVSQEIVKTAAEHQAVGYLLKQEVRMRIAWAIVYSIGRDFIITPGVARTCEKLFHGRIFRAHILPDQREYPELTHRIRQAIKLTVIEGMPAHLAADEMGISLHTIRGYVKEGYRILESNDDTDYPVDMTPQERAFMRFTALAEEFRHEEDDEQKT